MGKHDPFNITHFIFTYVVCLIMIGAMIFGDPQNREDMKPEICFINSTNIPVHNCFLVTTNGKYKTPISCGYRVDHYYEDGSVDCYYNQRDGYLIIKVQRSDIGIAARIIFFIICSILLFIMLLLG
jgi:hypothetical protein